MEKNENNNTVNPSRAFLKMLKPAVEWLQSSAPEDIAERAGLCYDPEKKSFAFQSLGQELRLSYPDYRMEPVLNEYHYLITLHYLHMADGTPLKKELMTFRELKDGMFRGGEFDQRLEKSIAPFLKDKSPEKVTEVCKALGGEIIKANADICAVFPFLPNYPITMKLWFADDEFEASGKMLVNAAADHYLTIEDSVMAATFLWDSIEAKYNQMFSD